MKETPSPNHGRRMKTQSFNTKMKYNEAVRLFGCEVMKYSIRLRRIVRPGMLLAVTNPVTNHHWTEPRPTNPLRIATFGALNLSFRTAFTKTSLLSADING